MSNKTRVIPTLLVRNNLLVKTQRFQNVRPNGTPMPQVKIYNLRNVDEMVILDIDARHETRDHFVALVSDILEECFMPLTVGGGIRRLEDIRALMKVGADKVTLNTQAVRNPEFIREAAEVYGAQCVVLSIDARKEADGSYQVYVGNGKVPTGLDPVAWAKKAESLGAGEVYLTSIDREGTMTGYDLELLRAVSDAVSVPVIANGGAGKPQDFIDAVLKGGADAVSGSSIFQYTHETPATIRDHMRAAKINVR